MTKNMGWQLWAAPVTAIVMSVAGTGCASDVDTSNAQAHVQVEVPKAFAGVIDRISVQIDDGAETDLDAHLNGQFTGLLVVPAGSRTFVGRAYAIDGTQVGQSQPLQATIAAGVVQGVQLSILDTTQSTSVFGPAVLGLTYPETGEVDAPFTFSFQVADPDGDAVAIEWTSTCADGVFSDATAATTTFTKPATGACAVTVTGSSSGFTVSRTFSVIVFPAGSQQGAVEITGQFVPAPAQPTLSLSYSSGGCSILPGVVDSTCQNPVRPGDSVSFTVYAYDGNYNTASISDNCGGSFYIYSDYGYQKSGYWYAPSGQTSCVVTASSTSSAGASSQSRAGIVFGQ
jgi:hypothetical protein